MTATLTATRSLIVDDEPTFRKGLATLAESLGHDVDTAAAVAEALAKLPSSPSRALRDLNLPDGLGTAVLERIRAERLPIKVAVVSGTSDAALLSDVERPGADAVFPKPPELGALGARPSTPRVRRLAAGCPAVDSSGPKWHTPPRL